MPSMDRVQVVPGKVRIFAVEAVSTGWTRLPKIPGGTYTVTLKHRGTNTAAIWLADHSTNPVPSALDYLIWDTTEGLLFIEAGNLDQIYVMAASGTQIVEIIAQQGLLGTE